MIMFGILNYRIYPIKYVYQLIKHYICRMVTNHNETQQNNNQVLNHLDLLYGYPQVLIIIPKIMA